MLNFSKLRFESDGATLAMPTIPPNSFFVLPANDKEPSPFISRVHPLRKQHHLFANHTGTSSLLPKELSMAPGGEETLCLGCNQAYARISLHWHYKPACCSSHEEAAAARRRLQHPVDTTRSHDFGSDDSISEAFSSRSEGCPSSANLDESGLIGAVICASGRGDTAQGSYSSSSAAATGTFHRKTTLADGSVANTRVSARNLKKRAYKRQRAGSDEDDRGDDDSLSTLQSEAFPCPQDDGDDDEEDDQEMHSYAAAASHQRQNELPLDASSPGNGIPPDLGTVAYDPLAAALERLPSLLDYESALLELDSILRKPRTRTTFDSVVSWLEIALRDNTFKDLSKLPRRKSLMKRLEAKFHVPPHELVSVALETGTEEGGIDDFQRGKAVKVPVWDFEAVLRSYLLDPIIFGNRDNLVNSNAPFEKFIIDNPTESKEYLASRHYSESYDLCVDDASGPPRQLFLPIDVYLDKSGKTAGITSSCGEPVLMTTSLLKSSVREDPSSWCLLGFIPDLEKTSSAKKQQEGQRKYEKGRNQRNYHKCLREILKPMQRCMDRRLVTYVRQGDELRYLEIVPVLVMVQGDGKSGDTLVCRYGGKNCIGRVPRLCMTPFKHLSDPMRCCPLVVGSHIHRLQTKSADVSLGNAERKKYRDALAKMSSHAGSSVLFELDYGANKFGITLATPTDTMRACESGVVKCVDKVFVASMPLSVQVRVDELIEKIFVGTRQSGKNRFSRTNFSGGACSLTMLSSHHWPGMTTAFLLLLLTKEGKEACKDCFAYKDGEDAPEPNYDWDEAPSLNINKAYKPPIIREEEQVAADLMDDYSEEDSIFVEVEDESREWMYDDDDDDDDADDDDDDDDFITEGGKKNQLDKRTTPLQCSYRQFLDLLQELLSFHAWYRYGDPPFNHNPQQEQVDSVHLRVRQMIARITAYCPRNSGYGWNIQKLHEHLHLVIHLLYFHHAMNWDAGRGERLLKPFFKDTAVTCQQRSTDVFTTQLAARAQEKLVLAKALLSSSWRASYEAILETRSSLQQEQTRQASYKFPVKTGYTLILHDCDAKCEFQWEGTNTMVQIHPVFLWWMAQNWHEEVVPQGHGAVLHCHTECKYEGPGYERIYRAHPNYQGNGEWYDWVMVKFGDGCFPSKVLSFYQKSEPETDAETGEITSSGIHAIIHSCEYRNGTSSERAANFHETRLCDRWVVESTPKPLQAMSTQHRNSGRRPKIPVLRSVPVETLDEHIYVVEETPGIQEEWTGDKLVWAMRDQRTVWSKVFLSEDNSFNTTTAVAT